jgi:hypothetical protein
MREKAGNGNKMEGMDLFKVYCMGLLQ